MKRDYGLILKISRENVGISQEYTAEQIGKSTRTVSDYERNITMPSIDILLKMSDLYNDPLLIAKLTDPSLTNIHDATPSRGVLRMLDIANKVAEISSKLIAVAADDVIDDHEVEIWNSGTSSIGDEMIRTGYLLKSMVTQSKKPLQDGNLVRAIG